MWCERERERGGGDTASEHVHTCVCVHAHARLPQEQGRQRKIQIRRKRGRDWHKDRNLKEDLKNIQTASTERERARQRERKPAGRTGEHLDGHQYPKSHRLTHHHGAPPRTDAAPARADTDSPHPHFAHARARARAPHRHAGPHPGYDTQHCGTSVPEKIQLRADLDSAMRLQIVAYGGTLWKRLRVLQTARPHCPDFSSGCSQPMAVHARARASPPAASTLRRGRHHHVCLYSWSETASGRLLDAGARRTQGERKGARKGATRAVQEDAILRASIPFFVALPMAVVARSSCTVRVCLCERELAYVCVSHGRFRSVELHSACACV